MNIEDGEIHTKHPKDKENKKGKSPPALRAWCPHPKPGRGVSSDEPRGPGATCQLASPGWLCALCSLGIRLSRPCGELVPQDGLLCPTASSFLKMAFSHSRLPASSAFAIPTRRLRPRPRRRTQSLSGGSSTPMRRRHAVGIIPIGPQKPKSGFSVVGILAAISIGPLCSKVHIHSQSQHACFSQGFRAKKEQGN